ncbi:TPA: hypothetical protein ACGO9U_002000, partial [Streptococcus suis]
QAISILLNVLENILLKKLHISNPVVFIFDVPSTRLIPNIITIAPQIGTNKSLIRSLFNINK